MNGAVTQDAQSVTQADREAAAALLGGASPDGLLEGRQDSLSLVQAFARHRLASQPSSAEDAVDFGDAIDPNAPWNRRKPRQPQQYRKTALITATQWFKDGDHPAVRMSDDVAEAMRLGHAVPWIETLEGGHTVTPGDWIATGVKGEHWPIKPDIFAATYEPVDACPTPDTQTAAIGAEAMREALERIADECEGTAPDGNIVGIASKCHRIAKKALSQPVAAPQAETKSDLSHDDAIKALCDCAATVTVLSYQEAIEGYFSLRGLPIPGRDQ